jgi:dienelactone hydrolase
MDELRKRVKRLVDICPAFEALANKREAMAKAAEQAGDKVAARDNYFMAANYWASAMWTIDEVNQKLTTLNDKKRAAFDKYIALADNGSSCPIGAESGKTVADWLAKRPEIDAGKIGMTGVSYGSFFTAIMMAADSRYKACAVSGTCYEPGGETIFNRASPTFKKRFMFMSGITDERDFDEFRKTIDWNGYAQKVKGAYLVACGEYDQLCPLEYTEAFMKALGGPKQLLVYEGGNHSIALTTATQNGPEPRQYQAEWIAARLEGKPFTSERWFVGANGNVVKAAMA